MRLKDIVVNDFTNYKKPSLFIITDTCGLRCEKLSGEKCCQNRDLLQLPTRILADNYIIDEYYAKNKDVVEALVIGGLEPFNQWEELYAFVKTFRQRFSDDIVIYTGYEIECIQSYIDILKNIPNIVVKFGHYIPHQETHYDEVLGVYLASDNQYAKIISN